MFCIHCGGKLGDGAKFCPSCGNPVENLNAPVQQEPVQQAPVMQEPQMSPFATPGSSVQVTDPFAPANNMQSNPNINPNTMNSNVQFSTAEDGQQWGPMMQPEKKKNKKGLIIGIVIGVVAIIVAIILLLSGKDDDKKETSSESTHSEDNEVNIGDTISYGNYNGNTEWIVLDKQDGKALLLSKYAIEERPYDIKREGVTWETCTLRSWLNGEYLTSAFSSEEQARIIESTIINSDNPEYGIYGGNNTNDKVFLLSIDEVNRYFNSDGSRKTTLSSGSHCRWWLRSPGGLSRHAAYVNSDGSVDTYGLAVLVDSYAVRPALWINLNIGDTESTTQETSSESTHSEDNEVNIGDTISYGNYNGNTEWIVLDKQDGKALLLSKYAIKERPYNIKFEYVTWETCTLRSWLNGEYLTSAFSSEEQARIIESTIINSDNPDYGIDGGNNTNDKVFLLSIDEVYRYFNSDGSRKTTLSSGSCCLWWLRSPGHGITHVANVNSDGSVYTYGCNVYGDYCAVRPALWINLKS